MKIERTDTEIKLAIFKGLFIEDFLKIEHQIHKIISNYFLKEKLNDPFWQKDLYKNQNKAIKHKNLQIKNFFEHTLFANPHFPTSAKLECLKAVIQISSPSVYKSLDDNKPDIFEIIDKFITFRNTVAHNTISYQENKILASKKKSSFKEIGKYENNEPRYMFVPEFDIFSIDKKTEDEIFIQMSAVWTFLDSFGKYFNNHDEISEEERQKHSKKMIDILDSTLIFTKDGGIYHALRTEEAKIIYEKEKQIEIERENKRKDQSKREQANKAKKGEHKSKNPS